MALIVYDHPLSPYGQKVKIALAEKGIPFETRLPAAIGSGATTGEFQTASPRGEVPALVDGDAHIFDSTVILEYIEDRWPEPALLPADPLERARARMLEDVMDTHFEAITWGLSELRNFGRGEGALADAMFERGLAQLGRWFDWLTGELGDREWFNGTQFGWADLCVVPFVNGAAGFGAKASGALAGWLARANARPSVAACTKAAAAVAFDSEAVSLDAVRAAMEQGLFKREYRDHRLEWMVKTGGLEIVSDGLAKANIRFIEPFPPGKT
ncbi:MAG: glutathione S-transferase family protein [Pseudomonadales bacterium]